MWDQSAISVTEANSFTYKYYPDSSLTGVVISATCSAGVSAAFTCVATFPAFTPGSHNFTMTASNSSGESPKSATFFFTFAVKAAAPSNIRIK